MATLRLRMYSGRPNPVRELSGADSDEMLRPFARTPALITTAAPFSILGYRGLEVRLTDEEAAKIGLPSRFFVANGKTADEAGGLDLVRSIATRHFGLDLGKQLDAFRLPRKTSFATQPGSPSAPPAVPCGYATYDPDEYNSNPIPLVTNNCYAYACARPTNTFPQPGRAHGYVLPTTNNIPETIQAYAEIDGLVNATGVPLLGGIPALYVALAFDEYRQGGEDYHFYRQVRNNGNPNWPDLFWAHKPGDEAVTNLDSNNDVITNPETCNRGTYEDFIGYMYVPWSVVSII